MYQSPRFQICFVWMLGLFLCVDQTYSQDDPTEKEKIEIRFTGDQVSILSVFFEIVSANETPVEHLSDEFLCEIVSNQALSIAFYSVNATGENLKFSNSMGEKIDAIKKLGVGKVISHEIRPEVERQLLSLETEWKNHYHDSNFTLTGLGAVDVSDDELTLVIDGATATMMFESGGEVVFENQKGVWLLRKINVIFEPGTGE